jgi:hypothetical protein
VAGFAERLQVALIPKEESIATMRLDVIADQERGVAFELAAALALTTIAQEYGRARQRAKLCHCASLALPAI